MEPERSVAITTVACSTGTARVACGRASATISDGEREALQRHRAVAAPAGAAGRDRREERRGDEGVALAARAALAADVEGEQERQPEQGEQHGGGLEAHRPCTVAGAPSRRGNRRGYREVTRPL